MKIFSLLKTHFKSLFTKSLLNFLLIFGMIIGSFVLVLYYSISSRASQLILDTMGIERSIEGEIDYKEIDSVYEIIGKSDMERVSYISLVSYENSDYDMIGLDYVEKGSDTCFTENGTEMITPKYKGKHVATVSEALRGDNDFVKINGSKFDILGIMPENEYTAAVYDIRRIGNEDIVFSGVEINKDTALAARPNSAAILPFDVFRNISMSGSSHIKITFCEGTPKSTVKNISKRLADHIDFTDTEDYIKAVRIGRSSNLIGYLAVVLAGLYNVISLYTIYIRNNKKIYDTYYMVGSNFKKTVGIILSEIFIITLFTFGIGCILSVIFLKFTNVVSSYIPLGVKDVIILILLLYICEVIICIPTILSQSGIIKNRKCNDSKSTLKTKAGYHFANEINGRNILELLSLGVLSFVVAYTLTFSISYLTEGYRYKTFYDKFDYDINVPMVSYDYYGYQYRKEEHDKYEAAIDTAKSLDGVCGTGEIYTAFLADSESENYLENCGLTDLMPVNGDFCRYSAVPLYKGSWDKLVNYDPESDAPIPLIIPWQYKDIIPYNSPFELRAEDYRGEGDFEFYNKTFIVVGILQRDSMKFMMNYSPAVSDYYHPGSFLGNYLEAYNINDPKYSEAIIYDVNVLIAPKFLIEDEYIHPFRGTKGYYLYSEKDLAGTYLNDWNKEFSRYGEILCIGNVIDKDIGDFNAGGGDMFYVHFVSSAVMLLLCIGSYTIINEENQKRTRQIYKMCGMTNRTAIIIDNIKNAISMYLPGLLGLFFGIVSAIRIRNITNKTVTYSVISTLVLLTVVFALSLLVEWRILSRKASKGSVPEKGY